MQKITTYSGAIYYLNGRTITGGSKKLKEGHLLVAPAIGNSLLVSAPERQHLNPLYRVPGVTSSMVVKIENISCLRYLLVKLFGR